MSCIFISSNLTETNRWFLEMWRIVTVRLLPTSAGIVKALKNLQIWNLCQNRLLKRTIAVFKSTFTSLQVTHKDCKMYELYYTFSNDYHNHTVLGVHYLWLFQGQLISQTNTLKNTLALVILSWIGLLVLC